MYLSSASINLILKSGMLVGVIGPPGSGKSSLLAAIIGEMYKLEGILKVEGPVSYVPQEPWIQTGTIQANIVFGEHFHGPRYRKAKLNCRLDEDMDRLPQGELTEVSGEGLWKGTFLTLDQKQRVNLARAVYRKANIYLFDTVCTATPQKLKTEIFREVIVGMLADKTRIVVDPEADWLEHMDLLVVMKDGQIVDEGKYEVLSDNWLVQDYVKAQRKLKEEARRERKENPEAMMVSVGARGRRDALVSESDAPNAGDESILKSQRSQFNMDDNIIRDEEPSAYEGEDATETSELLTRKKFEDTLPTEKDESNWKMFLYYLRLVGVYLMVILVMVYVLYQATAVFSNIWLSRWSVDHLLRNQSKANTSLYADINLFYLEIYGFLGLLQAGLILSYAGLVTWHAVLAARNLHARLLRTTLHAPYLFIVTVPLTRLISRFARDLETVDQHLPATLRMLTNSAALLLSACIVISYTTYGFICAIIPVGIFFGLIQNYYGPVETQIKQLLGFAGYKSYLHFAESITGASIIRTTQTVELAQRDAQQFKERKLTCSYASMTLYRWLGFRLETLGNFVLTLAAVFAVVMAPHVSSGLVGLSITYALQVTTSFNWLVRMTGDFRKEVASVKRIKELCDIPSEMESVRDSDFVPITWIIKFNSFSASYGEGNDPVLENITLTIQKGEKVGIIGQRNSGKTSLLLALLGALKVEAGEITIDSRPIAGPGRFDFRSRITYMPKEPVLFSGSLRMNIDPNGSYDDSHIWAALDRLKLRHCFQHDLPDKLDFQVEEGGRNLSPKQRQEVSLVRTALRWTMILALDEPEMGRDMEEQIQCLVHKDFEHSTVFHVVNRIQILKNYDKVIILEKGRLLEFGSPRLLMADSATFLHQMTRSRDPRFSNLMDGFDLADWLTEETED